jgi:hypothetical protein
MLPFMVAESNQIAVALPPLVRQTLTSERSWGSMPKLLIFLLVLYLLGGRPRDALRPRHK